MLEIVVVLVSIFVSPESARALASTAPRYLDEHSAREHLAAAAAAGILTRTKPATLLAIGHHESRYQYREITREPPDPRTGKPRWSCGVMTPEPLVSMAECREATRSIAAGYLAGARHLRAWLDVCGDHSGCALLGYAGAATHDCESAKTPACVAAQDFALRARWIERVLKVSARQPRARSAAARRPRAAS